jgi:chromosome segregation ATPase
MSEIKRYDNVNGGSIACHECYMDESSDGDYVRHADHAVYLNEAKLELRAAQSDLAAVKSREAALREELQNQRDHGDEREAEMAALREELAHFKDGSQHLLKSLTAAEQRNAELSRLLRRAVQSVPMYCTAFHKDAAAAIKPTESGASE